MKYVLPIILLISQSARAQMCSGLPVTGVASASTLVPCGSVNDTLFLTDYTTAGGVYFQWMSSPDAVTWTAIPGATNTTYDFTPSGTTYYMSRVVCGASADTAYSNYLPIVHDSTCPCLPLYEYAFTHEYAITAFSLNGYDGSSISDGGSSLPSVYELRPDTINLLQYHNYSGIAVFGAYFGICENEIWIDFNDDGIFEPSEDVSGVFGDSSGMAGELTYNINIPLTAAVGVHRMRIRNAFIYGLPFSTEMDPCYYGDYLSGSEIQYNNGSAWDYYANIIYFPPCQGTPNAGVMSTNSCTACGGDNIIFSSAGASTDSFGLTYQWQSSANDITWSNIPGGTTLTFSYLPPAKLYYRLQAGCSVSGGTTYSDTVSEYYESSCPCVPVYSTFLSFDFSVMNCFSSAGYAGTSLHDTVVYTTEPSPYTDKSCSFPIIRYQQGVTYNDTVIVSEASGSGLYQSSQVWIDFNDDGLFETYEAVSPNYPCAGCIHFYPTISIPATAATGIHRMRVRYAQSSTTLAPPSIMDPCAANYVWEDYYNGNAWDYLVDIVPVTSFSSTADTICQGSCITFINTSTSTADSILWSINGLAIPNPRTDTLNICFPTPGNDTAILYVFNSGTVDTAALAITVHPTPPAILGAIVLCGNGAPDSTTLTDSLSGGIWSSADTNYAIVDSHTGVVTLGAGISSYYDTAAIPLSVAVSYTLPSGCGISALIPIEICEGVPSVINGNNKITIAPNPALNELIISASDNITSLTITNSLGQTFYSQQNDTPRLRVDVSKLSPGLYFVNINGGDVKKFVKL